MNLHVILAQGPCNLLYIVSILVYVLPKPALNFTFFTVYMTSQFMYLINNHNVPPEKGC